MMNVTLHPHARTRLVERGATEAEVIETVRKGERFPAKYGRTGFRRNFPFLALTVLKTLSNDIPAYLVYTARKKKPRT